MENNIEMMQENETVELHSDEAKQIVLQRKKKAKIQPQEIVRIFALGGMDEDGKNMLCIEIDGDIYIVEAGIKFPDAKVHLELNALFRISAI